MARRRDLSAEDRALWSQVTRTAQPLNPLRKDPALAPKPSATQSKLVKPLPSPAEQAGFPDFFVGQLVPSNRGRYVPASSPSPAERLADSPVRMDHKTHRRMLQGKLRPEARLDLHGMTLAVAHPELLHFILSCHGRGLRLVLVITGKGRGDHGPLPTRPGALRHQVPIWLYQPPLKALVQQVTAAHYRHGGEGAYYIYLRR